MKLGYTLLLSMMTAVMVFIAVRARKKKNTLLDFLWQLTLVTLAMSASYLLAIYMPTEPLVLFFQGIYFASFVWVLTAFLKFSVFYAEGRVLPKALRFGILIISFADSVSLVVNAFTKHVFTYTDALYLDGQYYHNWQVNTIWYNIHLAFSYVIAFMIAALLAYKLYNTSSVYRRRYVILLGIFFSMLALDVVYISLRLPLDVNQFLFVIMNYLLYFFVLNFIPRDVVIRILSYAASSLHDGIVCFDTDDRLLYANEEAYRLLDAVGDQARLEATLMRFVKERNLIDVDQTDWVAKFPLNGDDRHYEYRYQVIRDDNKTELGYYFTVHDRTQEALAIDLERIRATHDSLTGLYNMDGFRERVSEILKADPDTPRFMLASNIKDFKLVNDLFGRDKGNELLVKTAQTLENFCGENEACGHLNSDHFVMLIERAHFDEDLFLRGAQQVGSLINSNVYQLCFQIGVYAIDDVSVDVSGMYDRANVAINSVKNENRSLVVYYSSQMMQQQRTEQQLVAELEQAIETGDLRVYLQPQVDKAGVVLGAEALVRWIHTERGVITPSHFISILEDAGLIWKLDLAVWEMACALLQKWKDTDKDYLYLSVNISPRDFYYIDIYKSFTELVEKYEIDPAKLHLEIVETALMNDVDKQHALVTRLRKYGFEVEIDDFGAGYSSLSLLKNLEVDTLKLDLEFVRDTEHKARSRTILANVVSLSRSLTMPVIAEGVENRAQLDYLVSLGCERFQGFYFSRPLQTHEFEKAYFPLHFDASRRTPQMRKSAI